MIEDMASRQPVEFLQRRTVVVDDETRLQEALEDQGARLESEHRVEDTYFMQPGQEVLKISVEDGTPYLVRLQNNDGRFDLVSRKQLNDLERCRADLAGHYGIQQELTTTVRSYVYDPYTVRIVHLDGQGTYLTVEGKDVEDAVFSELGIKDPEFVQMSLGQLSAS